MRKIAVLCVASLFLLSCVGIDSRLTVRDNGSGTLVLTYRVSQLVADLGLSTSDRGAIPLPLSRSDFERSLESSKGTVRLTRFERSENEKDITIRAELSFDSLDALARVDAFRGQDLKSGTDASGHTFSELIARAPGRPVSDESLRMIDAFFTGYDLTFTIEAPQPIKQNSLGTLSGDKRVLTYTTSIKDIVRAKSDVVLSLGW
jgi:hypothetical protein